jgi:hypothetical protein
MAMVKFITVDAGGIHSCTAESLLQLMTEVNGKTSVSSRYKQKVLILIIKIQYVPIRYLCNLFLNCSLLHILFIQLLNFCNAK